MKLPLVNLREIESTTRIGRPGPAVHLPERFTSDDWKREGDYLVMTYRLQDLHHSSYIRVRGTNTNEMEPEMDPPGEDPWTDLWFYSNAVFIEVSDGH